MRCAYVVRGKRCRRKAAPGAKMCHYHVAWFKGPDAPDMWADRVSREARRLLSEVPLTDSLDAEIALLRLLIRESVGRGDVEAARRAIEALARILLPRRQPKRARTPLSTTLADLLDQLAAEVDD